MKKKTISYAKWGYIFLIPFFVVYFIFSFLPLIQTFGYSFLDYVVGQGTVKSIRDPGAGDSTIINNGFCGFANYSAVLKSDGLFSLSFKNTVILWLVGFVPQIIVSLLLASWFTDIRLKLKAQGFFKTVIYLPNVIMASALSLLFYSLFTQDGALDTLFGNPVLLTKIWGARGVVGFINFLMWYGNTTILLMAAMMGIDTSLYEAAQIDGANPSQVFWQITMPLIKPILAYVLVTSMIGGLQMYDVPYLIGGTSGNPSGVLQTLVSQIQLGKNSSVGRVSALSVMVFIVSAILGFITLKVMDDQSIRTRYGKKKKK
ncbi:multiple sugar transport system permease protein [Ruminococcus sp. YE71]|uniref:carbohydrate ABC transporter permease n=1 Tax=unclassified Ruminococcus TaxID=2608920 RepID=UPI00088E6194|nr:MULTISPECIES: sugar ABC transporter permease [unclassified Ruminococcus]SDA27683.1 multiple sugar transport system permease protein [Ruminococcus sp. YE78]SFW45909.1 multiple sugar transport system permease protein [Ruminococcus sp. YE71]